MPSYTGESASVAKLMSKTATLLLLLRTDHTDLITKFTALLGQGMNMKTGCLRLRRILIS
jgi:hypothetical protein